MTEQFGLLNKSFRDIKKDFANGLGLKNSLFQTSISKTDYQALQKFNSAIKVTNDGLTKSQRITKAWNENMTGCSIAAKRMGHDLVTGKKNMQDISKAMNTASGSTKALGVAMNLMANVGFMLAITAITKVISELAQAQDNAVQAAKEATETYKGELDSIADYKQRLSELHEELKSGNLSYEETKTKRTELMTIQDELIEKFGTEKGAIESVTEAVNGQVDALDNLNEKAYRDWVAKADEQTFWNKLLPGGKSGLDQAVDYMESEKTVSFMDMQNANLSDELQAIQKEIDETIRAKYNLDKTFAMFNVTGTPDELRTLLENIRQDYADISEKVFKDNDINDHDLWDEYRKETFDSINEAILSLDKGLEKHQDTYRTYIEGLIKYDSEYSDEYANILQKRAELESAQNSGNAEEVKKAKQEFMDSINDAIIASDSDESIKKYFESLYPELQAEFDNWKFEFNLETNKDGINDLAKEIGEKYTATDLLNMIDTEGIQEGEESFNSLINKAIEYGVCADKSAEEVQKLIDLLVELGIVQDNIKDNTFNDKYPISLFNHLASSQESLDKFQSSVKSASDAYATLLSGNYSSSELLSSIQTINQAVKDMDGLLNWEFISSQADSLDVLGDAIQCVSTKYANSILSGAGIDINSDFGKMLADMIQQAYEVEAEFAGMNAQLDNLQSSYQTLTGILESYSETGYISIDNLQSLLTADENLIAMLEVENGQLSVNQEAYESLVAAQLMEFKAKLNAAAAVEIEALAKQKSEQATNQNADASNNAVEKLDAETAAINRNTSAAISNAVAKAEESGVSEGEIQSILDKYNEVWNAAVNNFSGDFSGFMGGGSKSAGSAGEEAADTYLEAFEKELSDLDDLKDRGKTTEKQYLDSLRRLYAKYFSQKKKYLKEYEKYEHQYLEGMKSLYESAFSYITKQIDQRIDAVNAEKDASVSRLEAERDASLEAIEAQKEQYENEIEGIEKQIDAKEKEIQAMQDANAERRRAVDLQKAEYDLQRMQNQKTANVYKGGQMVYEADTSGIRDARQEVEDAKLEIDIAKIEKEIGLLEDEKGILQERIDLLEKEAERINEYYDQLIADTERHYDAMAKGLEDYKSQFEELTDLLENAQMEAALAELGINMDALLGGSQEEFEKLKTAYIGILADMNRGNEGVLDQLSRLSGISTQSISYLDATRGAFDGLGSVTMEGLESSVDGIGRSVNALSASAGEASAAVGSIQKSVSTTSQSIAPLNEELGSLKTLISELIALLSSIKFPEIGDEGYAQKLRDIAQAFGEIASKCGEFKNIDFSSIIGSASASGMDGTATTDGEGMGVQTGTGFMGLASAISEAVTTIDEQMDNLQKALDIGNDSFAEQIRVITEEYIPAWEELQTRLAEIIGVGGGDGDNKDGRANRKPGSKEGSSESGGNDGSIIGIMQTGGEEVAARLEDPWLKAFNDFATDGDNSVQTVCDKIIELVSEMARIIQEKCEAAANALHELAKTASSSLSSVGGSESGNTVALLAEGTVGNAYANGTKYKGLPHDEKYALRSEYGQPELTVYPNGKAELTTEPTLGELPKGTVIFNEEQTKRIMDNEGEELGNAYAEKTIVTKDGLVLSPITPDHEIYWMQKKFDTYFKENKDAFLHPASAMFQAAESIDRMAETINNNNSFTKQNVVNIGDIHLHEVQDAHSLSRELLLRFPNILLQETKKI